MAWPVTNTKAVVPLTAYAGGRLGLVGITRAAVYPMGNYVHRLVTTSLRLIIPLSIPGPTVTVSSSTTFSSALDVHRVRCAHGN